MKTWFSLAVAAGLALGAAGCINYEEEITLRANGSGEATIHYWMASEFANMPAPQGGQDSLKFTVEEIRKDFEGVKGVRLIDAQVREEGGNKHATLKVKFDDVKKLASVGGNGANETITFAREKGKLIFTRTLKGEGPGPASTTSAPLSESGRGGGEGSPTVPPGAVWAAEEGAGLGANPEADVGVGLGANPEANEPKPKVISHGEKVDLKDHLVPGQTMIFDFYSHFCPPCRAISPQLEKLDEARKDLTVIRVDINRPGQFEIDWESPVAKQYHLSSVPYFRIYGPKGTLQSEGEEARAQVDQWIAEVPEAAAAQESSGDFEDLGKAVEQVGQELAKGLEKMGEQMGQALQEGQKGMEQADDAFAKMMGGMAGKLKFTVHFPGPVLEVDPAGTKEGNTARWEFPLMTLMTGGDVVMKATAQAPFSWLPVEVGAGVVFLLIVLGVARRMARGRRSYTPA